MTIRSTSPLRYPGGKSCLYDMVARILRLNRLERAQYAEPYAGGAGLALPLLFEGHVSDIHLNDVDRCIASVWRSVLNQTDDFIDLVKSADLTMDNWYRQRDIHLNEKDYNDLEVGFATFFLNRTNRSGIIKGAGVIGGLGQNGSYKMDCRFNKDDLSRRIRRISRYKDSIHLYQADALTFISDMEKSLPEKSFFCIDPPYYNKGSSLYTSFYNQEDHLAVSQTVIGLERPWILTYDNVPEISHLYKARRQYSFDVNYSVQTKRIGTELLVASKGLKLPTEIRERLYYRPQYRAA